jgi:Helix-turn-helix
LKRRSGTNGASACIATIESSDNQNGLIVLAGNLLPPQRHIDFLASRKAGLTQQALAKRLGQPQSFVAKYEGGERRLDVLDRLIGGSSAGSLLRVALIRAPTPVSQSYAEMI